jgi:hypothetical protein
MFGFGTKARIRSLEQKVLSLQTAKKEAVITTLTEEQQTELLNYCSKEIQDAVYKVLFEKTIPDTHDGTMQIVERTIAGMFDKVFKEIENKIHKKIIADFDEFYHSEEFIDNIVERILKKQLR